MMNISIGAALMMGAILPPAMMYPPKTNTKSKTRPTAAIKDSKRHSSRAKIGLPHIHHHEDLED
jgi:hypothetical protein